MEGKEPKIDSIPVKFDIWDTYYHVKDYGNKIEVSIPCRKYGKGRDKDSWTLGHYTEDKVYATSLKLIDAIRFALLRWMPEGFNFIDLTVEV